MVPSRLTLVAVATSVLVSCLAWAAPAAASTYSAPYSDFDNDGWPDLAIGIPGDKINGFAGAGSVLILYGSQQAQGISTARTQLLHQNIANVPDAAEAGDRFGASLATGNFDGDSYPDLAVGIPGEDTTAGADSGAIQTFFGSAQGLSPTKGVFTAGYKPLAGARLGTAMVSLDVLNAASGNDGRDGLADVAIGAPGYDNSRGRVLTLSGGYLGTSGGLELRSYEPTQVGAQAGASLAAGDFDGVFGSEDDLAIGEPGFDIAGPPAITDAGRVMVFYDASGLTFDFLFQKQSAIADDSETGDRFGEAISANDINKDGKDDLLVGVPSEDLGSKADAGAAIGIIAATTEGGGFATPADSFRIDEGDAAKAGDRFGAAVVVADLGQGSNSSELTVGVPGRTINGRAGAGRVMIFGGYSASNDPRLLKSISQDTSNVGDVAETGDNFGAVLYSSALDIYNGADLLVGVPKENVGDVADAGIVQFLYSQYAGTVGGTNSRIIRQGLNNVPGKAQSGDNFGSAFGFDRPPMVF